MRILILHQFYTRLSEPGIARFNLFAEEWRKKDVETWVVASSVNHNTGAIKKQAGEEVDESGVHIIRAGAWTLGLSYWSFLGRIFSYLSFVLTSFIAALRAPKPDVIIASAPPIFLGFVGWLAALVRGVPFVYEMRDIWPDEAIELGVLKNRLLIDMSYALEKFIYNRADLIVVNSPGVKEFLVLQKSVPESKIGVVPNPVRLETDFASDREVLGWSKEDFVVLYTGAHAFVYDFDTLLDAAKILSSDPSIRFVLVGGGRYKEHVAERVKNEGITNVELRGAVPNDEVGRLMGGADLCVASLRNMKFLRYIYATKVLNYMAAGKPILLAMEGVTAELLEKAAAGIVVRPGDAAVFAAAVKELKSDPARREKLGNNGRRFVTEYAESGRLGRDYLALLEPVVVPKG